MDDFNSSYVGLRPDILKLVEGKDLRILDIGCATGTNGIWIKKNLNVELLVGLEIDTEMAEVAKKSYDEVYNVDIETANIDITFLNYSFDYVILGDILEHLKDPWNILLQVKTILKQNGKAIISVPNIQHIETFIQVYMKGKWAYNERGIFDKTHIRFFTLKNIEDLVSFAGLKVEKVSRNFRFRDRIGSKYPLKSGKILNGLFRNLFTFQYIVLCRKG